MSGPPPPLPPPHRCVLVAVLGRPDEGEDPVGLGGSEGSEAAREAVLRVVVARCCCELCGLGQCDGDFGGVRRVLRRGGLGREVVTLGRRECV
jgi:hypothetical protein